MKKQPRNNIKQLKLREKRKKFMCALLTCRSRNTHYDKKGKVIICWTCGFINFIHNTTRK